MILLTLLLILILLFYLYIWFTSHDFSIAPITPRPGKVLAIFPHPDDETLTCGGTLYNLARRGIETHLAILTLGERGVEGAVYTPALKKIRTREVKNSAKALHTKLHLFDLGDGQLAAKPAKVQHVVAKLIDTLQPDLVITYDQSGLYGHPDHILVANIVTQKAAKLRHLRLWYVSRPQQVYDRMQLPVHMATDPDFLTKRTQATHRVHLSAGAVLAKIKSLYAHKSQHFAFKKSRPYLPLWFWLAAQTEEYYHPVQ
jgi:N-acetylglucosamine malate deacetylase 2